jgi:hypothetical protein
MPKRGWFELSEQGWQRLATGRPLGRLLLEAVQNAWDAGAGSVSVELGPEALLVEDDAVAGVLDERLIYTVFLTDKAETHALRGRLGRGLKELLAAMDEATVETIGATLTFDATGRSSRPSERTRGTLLRLRRRSSEEDLRAAEALLRLCIAPKGTTLRVNGRLVRRPRLVLALPSCELETVDASGGLVRAVMGTTTVSVYAPRRGEAPHLYELGVPIEGWELPWHVDVGQRVPLTAERDAARESFKLALSATLLEAMSRSYMDRRDLRADWVQTVIARWPVRTSVLDSYVSKLFPRGAVLAGTSRANDRARQLGAHIVDVTTHGAHDALARVLETADAYVRRRASEFTGEEVAPTERQERFAASVRWLARRIAGRVVGVRFFARDAADDGLLEDARADVDARVLFFNVRGPLRFDDVLDPATLGVVLHELAHLDAGEHDHRFLDRLQHLAGACVRLFAEGGPDLAARLRSGDPDAKEHG